VAAARAALDRLGHLTLDDDVRGSLERVVHAYGEEARASRLLLAIRRFVGVPGICVSKVGFRAGTDRRVRS